MVKTWSNEEKDDVSCEHCGSVYSLNVERFPFREKGFFNCEVCGNLLKEWNSTHSPNFKLKQRVGV